MDMSNTAAKKGDPTQAENPYEGKTPSQLEDIAKKGVTKADVTGYDVTEADSTGYKAVNQNAVGYKATEADATGYDANTAAVNNWNVTDPQTVQGQLKGIIAEDSPLMQMARTQSLNQMNRRGLINSSMAIGAGQEAVIKQALPIAQADAATYGQSARFNADAANAMAQFNANVQNEAAKFGANAENVIAAANQAAQNEAAKFGATAENVEAAANQAAQNEANRFGASAENAASLANAAAANEAAQFEAAAENISASDFAKNVNASVNLMMDQSMKIALANADSATKLELQNIDAETRRDLAAIEAEYKNQMQASASANELFQQVTKNIADIMANPDLDAAAKQKAVDIQRGYLKNGMEILSATSGISGLGKLVNFS